MLYEVITEPLETSAASIREHDTRARRQILYGSRHQDVAGARGVGDARGRVDGDAAEAALHDLTLTRVDP